MNASRAERIGAERRRSQNIRERERDVDQRGRHTLDVLCQHTHCAGVRPWAKEKRKNTKNYYLKKKGEISLFAGQRRRKKDAIDYIIQLMSAVNIIFRDNTVPVWVGRRI